MENQGFPTICIVRYNEIFKKVTDDNAEKFVHGQKKEKTLNEELMEGYEKEKKMRENE